MSKRSNIFKQRENSVIYCVLWFLEYKCLLRLLSNERVFE